ncbi:hypothetical protein BVRB_2g035810 [Beta vulgaris subsp. vulgaris]|nr:hypothetical protein BVRB_2g035810 [Beta vulgaris subsp. vulgaris]
MSPTSTPTAAVGGSATEKRRPYGQSEATHPPPL